MYSVLFNFSVVSSSVVYILSDLGSSSMTASYATVFYGLGNALTLPLALGLKDRIGIPRFFLVCQILFILTTYLTGVSETYPGFIFCRFLQGLSSGPLFTLMNTFLGSIATEEQRKMNMRHVLNAYICAPLLGSAWGAWIAYDYLWRHIFTINAIVMIILGIAVFYQLRKFPFETQKAPFDKVGYVTFFIGFFNFAFFITLGQELDWFRSQTITVTAILALIFLVFFVLWSWNHPYPILELSLFKRPVIPFSLINLCLLFGIYFGMVMLISIWLTLYVKYTVIWVAIAFVIMVGSMGVVIYVIRNYFDHHKVWIPFGLAIIFLGMSCFYTANFNVDVDFKRIAISRIMAGCGFSLLLPSIIHLLLNNVEKEFSTRAFAFFQLLRGTSSTLGATIFYTVWLRRQAFYHERLGGNLTKLAPLMQDFFVQTKIMGYTQGQANEQLEDFLSRQATSLALNDCFYLMGWITIALLLLYVIVFFKRRSLLSA